MNVPKSLVINLTKDLLLAAAAFVAGSAPAVREDLHGFFQALGLGVNEHELYQLLFGGLVLGALVSLWFGWRHGKALRRQVAAHKRTEKRLEQSESRFQQLIESAPEAIVTADGDGSILGWNRAAEDVFGYTAEEALGQSILMLVPEQLHKMKQEGMARAASGGQLQTDTKVYRVTGLHKSGAEVSLEMSLALWSENGQARVSSVMRDVTERLKTEQSLRQSRRDVAAILDTTTDVISMRDLDLRYLVANKAHEIFFGTAPEELTGRRCAEVLPAELARFSEQTDREALAKGSSTGEITFGGRTYHYVKQRVLDEMGNPRGVASSMRDVTDRKAVQAHVRNDRKTLRTLLDALPDLISLKDPDGYYTECNVAFARRLGRTPQSVAGASDMRLFPPSLASYIRMRDESVMRAGHSRVEEESMAGADGELRVFETMRTPLRGEDGGLLGILTVSRDMDDCRKLESSLKELSERAEQADRLKDELLASVSHEIRTPMHGILGMTEVALRHENDTQKRRRLSSMRRCADRLLVVVDELLDFSKLQAGRFQLAPQGADLHQLLDDVVEYMAGAAEARGLELRLRLDPSVPRYVRVDPVRLQQVLHNLIGNAIKYTDHGHCDLQVEARLSQRAKDANQAKVSFAISDTGVGIAEKDISLLFQAYSRVGSIAGSRGGTGLGLVISQNLVRLMGGNLTVQSKPGQGSTFRFQVVLPVLQEEDVTPHEADSMAAAAPLGTSLRVLAVEDEETNREVLAACLELLGQQVEFAQNGQTALESLRQGEYDIVLLDMNMPGMDGVEVARRVRSGQAGRADIPLLAMTASPKPKVQQMVEAAGLDGMLLKPVGVDALRDVLDGLQPVAGGGGLPADVPQAGEERTVSVPASHLLAEDVAMARLGNNPDLYVTMLEAFAKDGRGKVRELMGALAGGDGGTAVAIAHWLRGRSLNIGAEALADMCGQLETLLDDGRLDEAQKRLDSLDEMARSTHWVVLRRLGGAPGGNPSGTEDRS